MDIASEAPVPLGARPAGTPAPLLRLVGGLLVKAHERRTASAKQALALLLGGTVPRPKPLQLRRRATGR